MDFRWNSWNVEHVGNHDVEPAEAEEAVAGARSPFPLVQQDDRYLVWGRTNEGRFLQVVFVIDPDDTIYVIHARPLTDREKKRFRRRTK